MNAPPLQKPELINGPDWEMMAVLYIQGWLTYSVKCQCGDQITFGRGLLVGWGLADVFGLVMPRGTICLVFRYFMAEGPDSNV